GGGRRNAECQTQEASGVECGPHPAFRTPPFAPECMERPISDRAHPALRAPHSALRTGKPATAPPQPRLKFGAWSFPEVWSLRFEASRAERAFTMIEIAISLAVIGFALVAIIGILPTGMNVQKENREETIIGQDASV